ncbi:MAG TPA: sensor histidine kinase [Phycicoccus sp.]|nr:sensor histidine kinase [Phycicoccus sp.]HQK30452.1 sensor histidine kinase [Phycicoccus sp.]HQY97431.1 sensor histidine kinase [Phycicoccus sp.]HRA45362.1 sensor histidine kinase [Phycicoccus sp.]
MPTSTALARLHHGLFLVLVVVGVARSLRTGASPGWLALSVGILLAWYAVGLALARHPRHRWATWWLVGLTLAWLGTVLVSSENVWVAVSLWLLAGHFLRLGWAVFYTAVILAVLLAFQMRGASPVTSAAMIGPTIGAVFSLAVSIGQHRLVRDGIERQHLVDSLVRAQAETEELHAELVAAQRESGVLAERTRLAGDIHDGLAQTFSSILLTARSATGSSPDAQAEALARVESSAREGLDESRRVVAALAPHGLADTGLTAALRRTLDSLAEQIGLSTDLHVDGELSSLPTTVEVALLRVAQGALANVRQHAGASKVVVSLTDAGDSVRLDIVDDGRGFDPATLPSAQQESPGASGGGYGLRSSRDRLRALGGGLDIESRPGDGTALTAYLPLRPTEGEPT